ncbi:MAG TPA: hypothetical protein PLV61_14520 [Parvularculaceae bacterium]|nr:hypothetical protein [Amphiplicatus sp.]MCB9955985.1 hypothetical protein [Caulobacterales bacterium]HOP18801.1 hypothetical protein [Amphiplicatus sp.]HPE32401.1 hypothetical protein [Parvularculaceae bacterium]HRX38693.1 hypothetical protein [Parvularculaceae bacterium]
MRQKSSGSFGGEEVREESSWRYPLGIFLVTLLLCAVFLYYYVGPSVDEISGNTPSPAISEEPVSFTVGGIPFSVATNFTVYPRDRRGGAREEVALYALWPTMTGYTPARREEFVENPKDTRRIDIVLSTRTSSFSEQERIDILYLPYTNDKRGIRTPYQLVKYTFRDQRENVPTSGYADTELFLGETNDTKTMALFCFEEREDIRSPDCWREYELSPTVTVSYRFKRHLLDEWKAIDTRVRAFVNEMSQRNNGAPASAPAPDAAE